MANTDGTLLDARWYVESGVKFATFNAPFHYFAISYTCSISAACSKRTACFKLFLFESYCFVLNLLLLLKLLKLKLLKLLKLVLVLSHCVYYQYCAFENY